MDQEEREGVRGRGWGAVRWGRGGGGGASFSTQEDSRTPSWGRAKDPPNLARLRRDSPSSPRLPWCLLSSSSPRARVPRVAGEKSRPWSPSASYDLRERLCPGSALGSPGGPEQQVPTDEAEAQMLGSADLDDMKSE